MANDEEEEGRGGGDLNIESLVEKFRNPVITASLYDDLDKAIDYSCILTSDCANECNRCPLCLSSKKQLVDVLTGRKQGNGECSALVNCASDCIKRSKSDLPQINFCLRRICAYNCFDGSCYKCSAFITRIFNQACVTGNLKAVHNFEGHCYDLFKEIVYAKFKSEFVQNGKQPSIGVRPR
uniref:Uncharacterized protein n=1 Tax=Syphacia muris TaxID=451379 RepID=A0A0N5AV34_9BILA